IGVVYARCCSAATKAGVTPAVTPRTPVLSKCLLLLVFAAKPTLRGGHETRREEWIVAVNFYDHCNSCEWPLQPEGAPPPRTKRPTGRTARVAICPVPCASAARPPTRIALRSIGSTAS